MKIRIDIDCTPDEARGFFGLPDVKPLQQKMLAELEQQMTANLKAMDAESLMKTWLPMGLQGFEELQKAFWGQTGGKPAGGGGKKG